MAIALFPYDFRVVGHGISTWKPGEGISEKKGSTFHRIYFLLEGTAYYKTLHDKRTLSPRNCYILPTRETLTLRNDSSKTVRSLWLRVVCTPDFTNEIIEYPIAKGSSVESIRELLVRLHLKYGKKIPRFNDLVTLLFFALSETISFNHLKDLRIEKVMKHIRDRHREKLSVPSLAKLSGVEPHYFISLFKRITGTTPVQYVTDTRIAIAEELLATGVPIKYAAEQAGFADTKHFYRVFRKRRHMSPKTFKKFLSGVLD
jgi:AraC-like DNA-binding protein